MAAVQRDGFDLYNGVGNSTGLQTRWAVSGASTMAMVAGRYGGQGLQVTGGTAFDGQASLSWPSALSSFSFAFNMKQTAWPAIASDNNTWGNIVFSSDLTAMIGFKVDRFGAIHAYRFTNILGNAGTLLGSTANGVVDLNGWANYAGKAVIHDTTGSIVLYKDGNPTPILNLTNVDTRNGAPTTCNTTNFTGRGSTANLGVTVYDDYCLYDSALQIPEQYAETLRPNADTAQNDLTPSSGSDTFAMLDDNTSDGDATTASGSVAGEYSLCALSNLATTPDAIYAVQGVLIGRKTDGGTRSAHATLKSTTENDGDEHFLQSTYRAYFNLHEVNWDTSVAWTPTEVNALQGGPKVAA